MGVPRKAGGVGTVVIGRWTPSSQFGFEATVGKESVRSEGERAETDGFKRDGTDASSMSTATKVVLTTVAASALLSILLVFQTAFA
ncbi:hypothetical protein [Natrinema sp. DC36]|uniref:hypothetical protein n=1 Tax=Natrinema sp. DC36 TaxID=2878680 RepID=UPI001CEFD7C4|nr:hypothetical protein [Natrinema sp. DC36]